MKLEDILKELSSIFSIRFLIMMLLIAAILIFVDGKTLEQEGASRDSKLAKFSGMLYLFLGIGLFIAGKIF